MSTHQTREEVTPLASNSAPIGGTQDRGNRSAALGWLGARNLGSRGALVLILILLGAIFAGINGAAFLSGDNLRLLLSTQAPVGIIALAATVALAVGEVDLSIAGIMGASAGVSSQLASDGASPAVAILLALLLAAGFGVFNGLLITVGRLSSIIATLATGTLSTGVGLALIGPNTISGLPSGFVNLFASTLGGTQSAFYILLLLVAATVVILQWTLLGRRIFFTGQNRDSAALLGIRVRRLTIGSMITASLLAGFAGVTLAGQNGGANVTQTSGYLLPAFAAAFLGTTAIIPGRFNAAGTLIAVYVLGIAQVGLNMAGVATWGTYVFNAVLLIVSLGLFTLLKARKERLSKRESVLAGKEQGLVDGR